MRTWSLSAWSSVHLDAIAAIDRQSFRHPWQVDTFRQELLQKNAIHRVALNATGEVIAFACARLLLEQLHILKVAVAADYRNQGIGTELMNALIAGARERGASTVLLEVRPSNQGGLSLYRSLAFRCIATRPQYYPDTGEDAMVLKKSLKEDP